MRILVVTPTFLPVIGGAELGIYEIYQRLGKNHNVRILSPELSKYVTSQWGSDDEYLRKMNFEVRRFRDSVNFNLTWLKLPWILKELTEAIPPFSISLVGAVLKQLKEFRPDIVNFHYAIPCGLSLMLVRWLTKIPVVLSLVGRVDVLGNEVPFFRKRYVWWVVKSASTVLPISMYYLRWPPKHKLKNIHVIPYGTDTKRFSPKVDGQRLRARLGIRKGTTVLFTLQRLAREKRVDILIRSLKHIIEENSNVVLIIGGKGPEESGLKILAKELGVEGRVIFTGYIPENELPEYFAAADIFTFHSEFETFGIILAQALSSGKPIVSVKTTAIPEVVDNGLNGLLVAPLEPEEFARATLRLLNDRNMRESFAKNGRQKALDNYDWDIIASRYEKTFEDLLGAEPQV